MGCERRVCIDEIRKLQEGVQSWFELLVKDCEHRTDPLCLNKDAKEGHPGLVFCKVEDCPLI